MAHAIHDTHRRRGIFDAKVVSNTPLCREHYRLTLRIPAFPASLPGQFVQLECRSSAAGEVDHEIAWREGDPPPRIEGREFAAHDAFLRRPFSIAGRREVAGGTEIDLIGREVGPGTRFMARLSPGDRLSVVGPLGNAFELPPPDGLALLVGGGVGLPPMIYLAQRLAEVGGGRRAVAFAGALTKDLLALHARRSTDDGLFEVEEFAPFHVPVALTTDDGTIGLRGFVTDALVRYLDANAIDPTKTILYTCGPEPMMKRVQAIAGERDLRVQIAVERAMACGMGTCQSCCIRVKKPDPDAPPLAGKDWCWRLACTDGPVFDGAALIW